MYGKIFDSIYDGSLYGQWEGIVTLQQLIVLCDPEGFVDMTPQALAARTSIPFEIITKGIEILLAPDRYSRTEGSDGRRIEPIDPRRPWGWKIVNYGKYRDMRTAEDRREYMREYMRDYRGSKDSLYTAPEESVNNGKQSVNTSKQPLALLADADADADVKKIYVADATAIEREIIAAYHELLPGMPGVKIWRAENRRHLNDRIRETVKRGQKADHVDYWRRFFGKVAASDFLCGRTKDPWRCPGMKWFLKPANFAKVIEGNYDNVRQQ
jgi:hypothetical protein